MSIPSDPGATTRLRDAYAHCLRMAAGHYENFPVASHALPAPLRAPVAAIYAFARTADDYADEGDRAESERLALLDAWRRHLDALSRGEPVDDPVFIALADVLARHELPIAPFRDLLDAFTQDVTKRRYADSADLLDYCHRSANPVGRLLLHLFGHTSDEDLAQSDDICTALQLINFLQDLGQDFDENDRIYVPLDEMAACGVGEAHFAHRITDDAMLRLIELQAVRARSLLDRGAPLAWRLPGRIGLELRMIVLAAGRILDCIARERENVFFRPRLQRSDWIAVMWQTITGPKHRQG
jgi:squalene synthase HpnC